MLYSRISIFSRICDFQTSNNSNYTFHGGETLMLKQLIFFFLIIFSTFTGILSLSYSFFFLTDSQVIIFFLFYWQLVNVLTVEKEDVNVKLLLLCPLDTWALGGNAWLYFKIKTKSFPMVLKGRYIEKLFSVNKNVLEARL